MGSQSWTRLSNFHFTSIYRLINTCLKITILIFSLPLSSHAVICPASDIKLSSHLSSMILILCWAYKNLFLFLNTGNDLPAVLKKCFFKVNEARPGRRHTWRWRNWLNEMEKNQHLSFSVDHFRFYPWNISACPQIIVESLKIPKPDSVVFLIIFPLNSK